MTDLNSGENFHKIAVIGMAARYPKADNLSQYWDNLRAGKECISFFTDQELLDAGVDPSLLELPNYVKAGGVYEGSFKFDASFFGYTPREAEVLDPQQRIFLESCWEVLEDAGYDPYRYKDRIGLFGGSAATQYLFRLLSHPSLGRSIGALSLITANDKDYLATRVGYKLDLRGPCVTVQTACSTSLVAIVQACQSLLNYQSDIALAGGVRTDYQEKRGYSYEEGSINSPDGHCRTFDAKAKGTIWGNGAGVVALKRYDDAVADGDNIRAVILGYGLNNDGMAKVGFTAPGMEGQAMVTTEALAMAGVDAESISYVECHGTATPIGDPIEIAALTRSFRAHTEKKGFCAVGSVKTNIGHTDAAAGAAGFIKAVLSLEQQEIPASLNFEEPNPQIDFPSSPFFVNTQLKPWPRGQKPRRAGVNSFGIGGTNAHVILEEAPLYAATSSSRRRQLLVLSAKSPTALERIAGNLADHLDAHADVKLADVAYTLQVGRALFSHRRFIVSDGSEDAITILRQPGPAAPPAIQRERKSASVAFLFPGQGAQYTNMGRELYDTEAVFRRQIDECCEILRPKLDIDLRTLLFPAKGQEDSAARSLNQTINTQTSLFVVEYALAMLWQSWGVRPKAMLGHSIGEYVAACVAGVLSRDDALAIVAERGRLMQGLPAGAMTAVLRPVDDVSRFMQGFDTLCIAAVNNATTAVVSGPTPDIEAFESKLDLNDIDYRRLHTSHAFHSSMMDPVLDDFRAALRKVTLHAPSVPFLSNVTGTWITDEQATDPDYWARHLRSTVLFAAGAAELTRDKDLVLLEVGPGRTLCGLIGNERAAVSSLPQAGRHGVPADSFVLGAMGSLWSEGVEPDWHGFYGEEYRRRTPLPTYPFERVEYRISPPDNDDADAPSARRQPKKRPLSDWFHVPSWKRLGPAVAAPLPDAGCWLLFLDEHEVGALIAARLRAEGQRVVCVREGTSFSRDGDNDFTIRANAREDYARLLQSMVKEELKPARVLHFWAVGEDRSGGTELDRASPVLDRTFFSMLHLASELGIQFAGTDIVVSAVSSSMHNVVGERILSPVKATLLGPVKSIPREYPTFYSRSVDITLGAEGLPNAGLDMLFVELTAEPADEVIAIRGGHRWTYAMEPRPIEASPTRPSSLREKGVYLITGAMGGIGQTLAEYLGRELQARLVLVGRSAFPTREDWDAWLESHGSRNSTSERIRLYRSMEDAGAEVEIASADVADLAAMRAVVYAARERFGSINGVIHAAGLPGQGIMELKSAQEAAAVLAPKVQGTLVLSELLLQDPLDFFIVCSSLSGFIGSEGQADYVAGNTFMDAFAQSRAEDDVVPLSIDWDRWDEIGMALTTTDAETARERRADVERKAAPIDHPVFRWHQVEGSEHTFLGVLDANAHWLVSEHKLLGAPTLVGTAYIELVRAAYALASRRERMELRDVVFLGPLMVEADGSREIRVILRPAVDDAEFEFMVRSRSGDADWQDHAMGRVTSWEGSVEKHDLAGALARLAPVSDIKADEDGVLVETATLVEFSKRWDNLGAMAASDEEAVATLTLGEAYLGDMGPFALHPAMMDTAIAYPVQFASKGSSYLPFAYNRIRISRPFTRTIHSMARFRVADSATDEFLNFDLIIVDEHGEEAVRIDGYGLKRVSESLTRSFQQKNDAAPAPRQGLDKAGERILTAEGLEAFLRVLSLPRCPQIGVAAKGVQFLVDAARPRRADDERPDEQQRLSTSHPRPDLSTPYVAPRSELEEAIAEVWQTVLGIDRVGVDDNFVELGGHSLLAIQLTARIRELFEIKFAVASLYKGPTIAELTQTVIESLMEGVDPETLSQALQELA